MNQQKAKEIGYIDYACPEENCDHRWLLIPGHYHPDPPGRRKGHCHCGHQFPTSIEEVQNEYTTKPEELVEERKVEGQS